MADGGLVHLRAAGMAPAGPARTAVPAGRPVAPGTGGRPAAPAGGGRPAAAGGGAGDGRFAAILQDKLAGAEGRVQFSRHALERLQAAGRAVSAAELRAVEEAVERAAAKGARESLILMADLALVVSVRNRTVITAVDQARMREQVFTNIDSAVIIRGA